jgi:NTP pyrophosphatase (non-canonical NTP hydrolase)
MLQRCMTVAQQIVSAALTPRRDAVKSTDYLIEQTERWAADRQILTHSDAKAQALKLVSEVGELADAIIKNDEAGVIDGIGDCTVVLVILAKMTGLTLPMCLAAAYEEIKDRKGRMVPGGAFVKEQA